MQYTLADVAILHRRGRGEKAGGRDCSCPPACTGRKEMREGSVSGKQAALFGTQDRTVWVNGGFLLLAALQMPGLRLRAVPGLQMESLSSPTPAQALRFGVFCGDGKVWAFQGLGGICRERVRGETQQRNNSVRC